jgi:hypothetical protein
MYHPMSEAGHLRKSNGTVSSFRSCLDYGHRGAPLARPKIAKSKLLRRSKRLLYSITVSARPSSVGGIVRPIDFAVLRLITSSNVVGCSIGISLGFAPAAIFWT